MALATGRSARVSTRALPTNPVLAMVERVRWNGLVDTHPVCRRTDEELFQATLAAAACSPKVLGADGNAKSNVELVVESIREGMLAQATAAIAAAHERLTTQPPCLEVEAPMVQLTKEQERALWQVCLWRVAQIWYEPLSQEALSMYQRVHQNLQKMTRIYPSATESLVVALCHAMCAREHVSAGGDCAPFAPTIAQPYLNNNSALLNDPVAAYCLLESANDASVYRHLSERLQRNSRLNMHLVLLAGDDVLAHVPSHVYGNEVAARAVQLVRRMHYSNNPRRTSWLRPLAKRPRLVYGRGSLKLVDVDGWRARG